MSSLTSVNTSGLQFSGLATGIDTDKIVAGLTKLNQQRIDALKSQQVDITTRQTAFSTIRGRLFDLQSKIGQLARSAGGAFDARKVTVSDGDAVTAAAGTAAVPGNYALTVNALAQAQQSASDGFLDPNTRIKEGTYTLKTGTGTATTVTLTASNNTLQGLVDGVNAAGGDFKAAIINDGSAAPYRVLLTSSRTGAANGITVTTSLTAGTGADVNLLSKTVQDATDAEVELGTGSGAITFKSATNQVNGLIPGVSLNLATADPAKTLTLTVANDTAGAETAIKDFVDSYNALQDFVADQSKFDAATNTAGVLLGNRDVAELTADLSAAVTAAVPGLSSSANRLSAVGLALNEKGKLTLDAEKLTKVMGGDAGVALADVKRLFGMTGTSTNPGVGFVLGSDRTKPTGTDPVTVTVTAPATRAVVVATGPPYPSVVISPPNNTLMLKLNGLNSGEIALDAGTYTDPAALVAMLQQRINTTVALSGNLAAVGLDGSGRLTLTSQTYGSGSKVEITGGTAPLAAMGLAVGQAAAGTDVAGGFQVGTNPPEAATGVGDLLTGAAGNANTDGLAVRATLTAPGTADVTVTRGLAARLSGVLGRYLDPVNGKLKGTNDTYQKRYDDLGKTITRQNDILQEKTADLQSRFAAMETAVNGLKTVQAQLSSLVVTSTK